MMANNRMWLKNKRTGAKVLCWCKGLDEEVLTVAEIRR